MRDAIGALAIGSAGAWLTAAILGLGGTQRVGLVSSALLSGLGGVAAAVCGVLLAVHGAGPTFTLGTDPVGGASFHLAPLAAPFILLLGVVAPRSRSTAPATTTRPRAPPSTSWSTTSRCWPRWRC